MVYIFATNQACSSHYGPVPSIPGYMYLPRYNTEVYQAFAVVYVLLKVSLLFL